MNNHICKNSTKKFQKSLLRWFEKAGRKNLPWQQHKTPYRVWLSEIMLQQTQVATVIPYFLRFLKNFPNIQSLAIAPEDSVLHLWTGLGYYNRARNLHRTAKIIVEQYNGEFPQQLSQLEALPGIGLSTAGAILALGFDQRAAILDGNVKRVLMRFHGITAWAGDKTTLEQLWYLAEQYTPTLQIADYTQAMMDLGAMICTRTKPRCDICPLVKQCLAHTKNIQHCIPATKSKKILPIRQKTFLVLQHEKQVLLEKRPATGVWAKLWSMPEILGLATHQQIKEFCREKLQLKIHQVKLGETFRHTFSHFHLDILPAFITLKTIPTKIMENNQQIWYSFAHPPAVGLPQPIKKLIQNLKDYD
jgi:A/G-specific adenine glycosylase